MQKVQEIAEQPKGLEFIDKIFQISAIVDEYMAKRKEYLEA